MAGSVGGVRLCIVVFRAVYEIKSCLHSKKTRLHYRGAVYHVMVRGNAGQNIFADDEDRYRFYLFLQEGVEKFGHRIHVFCLMNNHVHLAIQGGRFF